jgi:hypothetical protein
MKTLHTPAPWHVEQLGDAFIIETPGGISGCPYAHLARVHMMTTGVGKHNARLIAAAPDLLEACKYAFECLSRLEINTGDLGDQAYQTLQDAIAKATGETDPYEEIIFRKKDCPF